MSIVHLTIQDPYRVPSHHHCRQTLSPEWGRILAQIQYESISTDKKAANQKVAAEAPAMKIEENRKMEIATSKECAHTTTNPIEKSSASEGKEICQFTSKKNRTRIYSGKASSLSNHPLSQILHFSFRPCLIPSPPCLPPSPLAPSFARTSPRRASTLTPFERERRRGRRRSTSTRVDWRRLQLE